MSATTSRIWPYYSIRNIVSSTEHVPRRDSCLILMARSPRALQKAHLVSLRECPVCCTGDCKIRVTFQDSKTYVVMSDGREVVHAIREKPPAKKVDCRSSMSLAAKAPLRSHRGENYAGHAECQPLIIQFSFSVAIFCWFCLFCSC